MNCLFYRLQSATIDQLIDTTCVGYPVPEVSRPVSMPHCPHVPYSRSRSQRSWRLQLGWVFLVAIFQAAPSLGGQQDRPRERVELLDGTQHLGRLDVSRAPPVFQAAGLKRPIPIDQIASVHVERDDRQKDSQAQHAMLVLAARQRIAGRLLRLDQKTAFVELADGAKRSLPRQALLAAEQHRARDRETAQSNGALPAAIRLEILQDGVRLRDGSQIYGKLETLNSQQVELYGIAGKTRLALDQIAAVYLRRERPRPQVSTGVIVRLWFEATGEWTSEPSRWNSLIVRLVASDGQTWLVDHPDLGRLKIARSEFRRLDVLHVGRRIVIAPHFHHLGNEMRPWFDVAPPEGTQLQVRFELHQPISTPVQLSVTVVELEGESHGARFENLVRTGWLQTQVRLNGQVVDYLNRHLKRSTAEPHRLLIPLPEGLLKQGPNTLEFSQTPQDGRPGEFDDCGLFDIALQMTDKP